MVSLSKNLTVLFSDTLSLTILPPKKREFNQKKTSRASSPITTAAADTTLATIATITGHNLKINVELTWVELSYHGSYHGKPFQLIIGRL